MADDMRKRVWFAVQEAAYESLGAADTPVSDQIADAVDAALAPILAERDRETARKALDDFALHAGNVAARMPTKAARARWEHTASAAQDRASYHYPTTTKEHDHG